MLALSAQQTNTHTHTHTHNLSELTSGVPRTDPMKPKVIALDHAVGALPLLPTDVWRHIFQLRATRMWFENKCLREIRSNVYGIVESCNPQKDLAEQSLGPLSIMQHPNKRVTYRWCNAPTPKQCILRVERSWLENIFQVRFKRSFTKYLVEQPVVPLTNWQHCYIWLEQLLPHGLTNYSHDTRCRSCSHCNKTVHVLVSTGLTGDAEHASSYAWPTIHWPPKRPSLLWH